MNILVRSILAVSRTNICDICFCNEKIVLNDKAFCCKRCLYSMIKSFCKEIDGKFTKGLCVGCEQRKPVKSFICKACAIEGVEELTKILEELS